MSGVYSHFKVPKNRFKLSGCICNYNCHRVRWENLGDRANVVAFRGALAVKLLATHCPKKQITLKNKVPQHGGIEEAKPL